MKRTVSLTSAAAHLAMAWGLQVDSKVVLEIADGVAKIFPVPINDLDRSSLSTKVFRDRKKYGGTSTRKSTVRSTVSDPLIFDQRVSVSGFVAATTPVLTDDDHRAFLQEFMRLYAKWRNGQRYFVQWARDSRLIKVLLQQYGRERLTKIAEAMLQAPDAYPFNGSDRGVTTLHRTAGYTDGKLRQHGL